MAKTKGSKSTAFPIVILRVINIAAIPGIVIMVWLQSTATQCGMSGQVGCGEIGNIFLFPFFAMAVLLLFVAVVIDVVFGIGKLMRLFK